MQSKKLTVLTSGDYFGELAFLMDSKRSASAISINYCTFGILNSSNFAFLLNKFP
jgi:CRP-like cAMP-binding protein